MRVCLLATGDATANPRIAALASSLRSVGHDVAVVCGGRPLEQDEEGVHRVPTRIPVGGGSLGSLARRAQPSAMRRGSFHSRLVDTATTFEPDLVYATSAGVVPLAMRVAEATGAAVVTDPRHHDAGNLDIIRRAPGNPDLSTSPAGRGVSFHTAEDDREVWVPAHDRHAGRRVVLAYRPTATTPARYLHSAFDRAGVDVTHIPDTVDWSTVDADTDAVVFVESPYPALDTTGTNPGVPSLLWAHHGEHHTDAHLRLIVRYGIDAVLLAHSWHLAHRYPVPVHRFPFAVATELLDASAPWDDRKLDVAFVGSISDGHAVRRAIADALIEALPADRIAIVDGATPGRLAALYADARVVFNDGGTRHHPITMRVFEAIGSGAALITEEAPGLELLFAPGEHYRVLERGSAVEAVVELLSDPQAGPMAAAAYRYAAGRHTYDHRVDELLAIAGTTETRRPWRGENPESALGSAVLAEVEISTVAAHGATGLARELDHHAIWVDPNPGAQSYDAVVIGAGWQGSVESAAADATRFVFIADDVTVPRDLDGVRGNSGVTRVDLDAPGYRVSQRGRS